VFLNRAPDPSYLMRQTGKYQFGASGDSNAIFVRVFGTDNPFAELFQAITKPCPIR
jgi:hypothetical protein